ncbi:glycosyltransferase [Streptomyces sp. NPDC037389]|uniref:glycosyltransferase family 2 protein n=1 Tax=Streptomyces sp. NPDC037389 TaxID=3155369 RepID=UPI0033C43903
MNGETAVPPLVSVVVAVREDASHLLRLLKALMAQDYRGLIELVAVDTHGKPALEQLGLAGSRLAVRVVHEPDAGLSRARNVGIGVATGEVVLITDPDARPSAGWVRAMVTALTHGGADLVCGQVTVTDAELPGTRLPKALLDLAGSTRWPSVPEEVERPWEAAGCNLGFRKSITPLQFDEAHAGADRRHHRCGAPELATRLWAKNGFVQAVPDAVVHRDAKPTGLTLRTVLARAWWRGRLLARLAHHYPQARLPGRLYRLPDGDPVRWLFTRAGRLAGTACLAGSAGRQFERLRLTAAPCRPRQTAVAAHR